MNRLFLIILALACFVTCGGTSRAAGPPEIARQIIDVSIAATGGELRGESTLTIHPHGSEGLSLELYPSAVVSLVSVDGREVPFRFSGGTSSR